MPKYKIEIKEILRRFVEIEAKDANTAISMVRYRYNNEEIV